MPGRSLPPGLLVAYATARATTPSGCDFYLFEGGALPGFSNYTFQTLQPFTVGTELTLPPTNISAPEFKGPVFLMNGQEDLLSCAGACSGPDHDITAAEKAYFGSSSNFTSFNIPNTGLVVNVRLSPLCNASSDDVSSVPLQRVLDHLSQDFRVAVVQRLLRWPRDLTATVHRVRTIASTY